MLRLRSAAVALAALAIASSVVFAAGLFPGFPIVGGASYCSSQSTSGVPGTTAVCNATVPAGPTALTGTELIPADTGLASGQQPQTVSLTPAVLGAGPHQYAAPLTGASLTVTAAQRRLILEPAGTIAALTVVMPAATGLVSNQLFGICTTQIVTSLTVTAGSGTTVLNAPSALLVPVATGGASCVEWVYRLTNTSWYRVQ